MKYNALLFCPDEKTARVVTQVLNDLEFRVEPCNEPFAAVKKLMAEHFDAIVVDCDSEQNAALLFKSAHNSGSNQSSLAVAVVEGQAGVAKAFRIGANLVLTKPINVEQSKGTLRVARGLLRKTDAARPASTAPSIQPPPRPVTNIPVTSINAKRVSPPQIPEPKPTYLPTQPPPSPIPPISSALFEVEADPGPKPEPTEAALLESMPDPPPTSPTAREYPWQPISKPAAEPMTTALRQAAEVTGRSEVDAPATGKIPPSPTSISDAPISRSHSIGMSSGQAAATAPAKTLPKPHDDLEPTEMPEVEAPAFASLGGISTEPTSGGNKRTILIAAALLVAVSAIGYVGWTKMQAPSATSATQTAPLRTAPAQPQVAQPLSSQSPAQDTAIRTAPSPPVAALPVEQGPDITLSTTDTRPPAAKKSTSIIAPNTVIRTQPDTQETAPLVVKNEAPAPASPTPAEPEPVQPPAPGSLDASNANNQAISGIISTPAASLPHQASQQLKVSQGVSQGLLIKSVPPAYPALARQMRVQGSVELLANIGKDGSITKVSTLSGDPVLARAAIDAVKQWKYKPYYLDDQPVEIQTQITVNFKLP
ncbi:MAG: TonB family protein [Candidatus Sulfotelmatobacter sp.]